MVRKVFLLFVYGIFIFSLAQAQKLDDTLSISEVVVTGSRVEISRKNLPLNITILDKRQIDEIQESSVLPMISRRVPGLFVTQRGVTGFGRTGGASAGNISIRGVGGSPNNQVLVLVDGHPQYMGIFGHPLPNSYVASDIEKVEIIKGPASILYGSNAMGGVLNFITKEQKEDGFSGGIRAAYGSYNTQKYMANAGYRKGKFNMFVSYNHDQTDGHRDSMNFNIDNAYLKAGYKFNEHLSLSGDFNIADFRSFDPGTVYDTVPAFRADIIRGKASVSLRNKYEKTEGGLFAFYNYGDHDFSDGWQSRDENYGIFLYQGIQLFKGNLITAGFDYKKYGGVGNIAFPPANADKWLTVNEAGAYLILRQKFSSLLDASAGLRIENNSVFGSELIPQFGLAYHPGEDTNIKFSASKGFRSPTITELYLFAPNPDLQPETMMSYELGIMNRFLYGVVRTEFTIFYLKGQNLIRQGPNPAPPPMFTRFNTGDFEHMGLELEANVSLSLKASFDLSYSYLSMDEPKVAAPEQQGFAGLNYKWDNFLFTLQGNYVGGLYTATMKTEGVFAENKENYMLINASVKYLLDHWELFVSGKNLTDTEYQIDYGYPMPGINFMLGAGFKF